MCMNSSANLDTTNQDRAAALSKQMEEDWLKRFQPFEQELAGDLLNQNERIADQVKEAQGDASKSFEASRATAQRNMARYGGQMDADQKQAMDKSRSLQGQGTQVNAMNSARKGGLGRANKMMQSMINTGRNVQAQGLQGLKQGIGMEGQRNQTAIQGAAAESSSNKQMVATAAMMAMMMMSDKNAKKNIRKASTKKALKDVEAVDLKRWDYKPGMSAGREEKGHIGGMAQDMPKSMTTRDKRKVDIGDSVMTLVGATQEISKRIGMLEKNHERQAR